jgi:serine/threonine protein kinase
MTSGRRRPLPFNLGPEWTDISLSDVEPLPEFPKQFKISNPKFLARSHHSHVYTLDVVDPKGSTFRALIKIFPKQLQGRYLKEVNAYRFLCHYEVPEQGVVPQIYGVIPSINKRKLSTLLGDSIPENLPIVTPAAAVVMEFIDGAVPPTRENMTPEIAKRALRGLRTIHNAHVLHGDAEARNILVNPKTGKVVWIDFSSATINRIIMKAIIERDPVRQLLYHTLVISLFTKLANHRWVSQNRQQTTPTAQVTQKPTPRKILDLLSSPSLTLVLNCTN